MVHYTTLDRTLSAISDPKRRMILDLLAQGPASISELAEPFGMSLTGLKKHIQILEEVGLVATEKVGRSRRCQLGPEPLDEAVHWIETYRRRWERSLDGLEAYLDEKKGRMR